MNEVVRKLWRKGFIVITVASYFLIPSTPKIYADTAQGSDYILHMQVNTDPNDQTPDYNKPGSYRIKEPLKNKPTPTQKPIAKPTAKLTPPPLHIQLGYTDTKKEFQFILSDIIVDFGPLSPTDFITRTTKLTTSGDVSYLYNILAYENHTLENEKKQPIPSTRCDNGNCSDTIAGDWTDTLTFGFGYHCQNIQGSDCEKNFTDKDSYKHFTETDQNQAGAPVMQGNVGSEKKANIVYKINVPGTQSQGTYQNTITYIDIPMY